MRNYTGHGYEGAEYAQNKNLSIKEIAALIRAKLKTEYPACKFSVQIERYSGGQSLHIHLMAAPFRAIMNKEEQYGQINHHDLKDYENNGYPDTPAGYNNGSVLSKEAFDCLHHVNEIVQSYNYDDSDSMIDYFDTNFYFHLEVGKWDKPFTQNN
jgi:hypothetical protein